MFLMMGFGAAQVANTPGSTISGLTVDTNNLLFIATAFGMSLMINAWIFYRVSGSAFNPAVTFALALTKAITPARAALFTIAQVLGGITAAAIIHGLTPGNLNVSTRLGGGMSTSRGPGSFQLILLSGLFLEMFLTAQLVLAVFMLAVEKHKATFIAPVGIGLTLFTLHLAGIFYTGASMNPARSFGPDVVIGNFPAYHWIYCIPHRLIRC